MGCVVSGMLWRSFKVSQGGVASFTYCVFFFEEESDVSSSQRFPWMSKRSRVKLRSCVIAVSLVLDICSSNINEESNS